MTSTAHFHQQIIGQKGLSPQIFQGLDEQTIHHLIEHSVIKNFEAFAPLIEQGEEAAHIYLLLKGSAKTLRTSEDGQEIIIRLLKPGETCMDAVIFMGCPSPVRAEIIEASKLMLIPKKQVLKLIQTNAQFSENLLKVVTYHYKNAMQQIDSMGIKSPLQRVGYYLLQKLLEARAEGKPAKIPFKKFIIANHLGITPETFSRALKQLKTSGVELDGEYIHLSDPKVLCGFCDTDTEAMCESRQTSACPKKDFSL